MRLNTFTNGATGRASNETHGHGHQCIVRRRSNSLPFSSRYSSMRFDVDICQQAQLSHCSRSRRVSFVEHSSYGGNQVNLSQGLTTVKALRSSSDAANDRNCWWEPDTKEINDTVDFALETSLHGLKYICQPKRHITERVFWLVAFLTGLIMAGWLISEVWLNYLSSPLIVTFEPFETTIDKIPFPAVTICNMNKVLKSRAEEYIKLAQGPDHEEQTVEARKNAYYLDHVCSSSKSFSQKFNYSTKRGQVDRHILERTRVEDGDDEQRDVARFLQIASQPCSEMLLLCAWQDTTYNCSDLFKPIETDFGKCCTFNMIPHLLLYKNWNDKRYDAKEILGWSQWDIVKNGLLVDDHQYLNSESPPSSTSGHTPYHYTHLMPYPRRQKRAGKSSGLSVLLNPDFNEYFCSSSDSYGFQLVKHLPIDNPKVVDFGIAIRPNSEVFMGVRPEITIADRDIYNFKLEKRNCYYYGEFPLAYYKLYTSSNCYDECLANQTFVNCGCVSYYMPRDDKRDLCGASNFQCAEIVRKSALQSGIKSRCDFCLPACTELEYFSETTFTPIRKGSEIWVMEGNITAKWAHKNLSIVHIYFASDSSYARVRKELYGLTDLIANTGGLMGLCLGFSGLSLVELIYFYTLRAWCRNRRARSIWLIAKMKFHRMWIRGEKSHGRPKKANKAPSSEMELRSSKVSLCRHDKQQHIALAMEEESVQVALCRCKSPFYYSEMYHETVPREESYCHHTHPIQIPDASITSSSSSYRFRAFSQGHQQRRHCHCIQNF